MNPHDEQPPTPVAATPQQAGATRDRWWVARCVWTERRLARLTAGESADRVWFRLWDKTHAPAHLDRAFNFPDFNLPWRKSFRGRGCLHAEPSQKSQPARREKLRDRFNHRTLWRATPAVVGEANRVLRGWDGEFHPGNSTSVRRRMRNDSRHRLRRWRWRKHACRYGLWEHYPDEPWHARHELHELPATAKWQAA
jgi:hypothetical protein